jgi:hypothetical protein
MYTSSNAFFISLGFSAFGLKLIYDSFLGNTPKIFTTLKLPGSLLVVGGVICQFPVLFFIYAVIGN